MTPEAIASIALAGLTALIFAFMAARRAVEREKELVAAESSLEESRRRVDALLAQNRKLEGQVEAERERAERAVDRLLANSGQVGISQEWAERELEVRQRTATNMAELAEVFDDGVRAGDLDD